MSRADDRDSPGPLRERLAGAEATLRYLERAVPLGLWDWDLASGRVSWSPGQEALYGLPAGSFDGSMDTFWRFVHPDDVEQVREMSERVVAGEDLGAHEFRILRRDGSLRWLASRVTRHVGARGRLLRLTGVNFDVTDARKREQELRLRDAMIQNMAEGVHMVSASTHRFVFANPRFEAMLGYGPGELLGQPVSLINSPTQGDPEGTAHRVVQDLERDGYWHGLILNRRKDGSDIWTRATVSRFQHELHGTVWVNSHADVTEEHVARLERDRFSAELNRLAGGMQLAIEAERAAVSRDVHDHVGAALTAIRLRLQARAARIGGQDAAGAAELLEIARLAQAASTQTREICARLRPPALDDLGLVATCRWHLDEWAAGAGAGIALRRRLRALAPEPPGALATDVYRTLQELLTNVARHAQARSVRVSLEQRGGMLQLRVADDGRGFPPREQGRGLGLVGVRERAARHGGAVQIETGPDGATVTARFPLREGGS